MTSSGTSKPPEPPEPSKNPVNVRRLLLWRWHRNPLRRRSDLVEAWLGMISVLAIAVGGTVVGALAFLSVTQNLTEQRNERQSVPALVIEDVGDESSDVKESGTRYPASTTTVRWTAPDGSVREGSAVVEPDVEAGAETTVWIDQSGRLVREPVTRDEADIQGVVAALIVVTGVCLMVLLGRFAAVAALDRQRAQAWEYEWAEFGPHWQSGPNGPGK